MGTAAAIASRSFNRWTELSCSSCASEFSSITQGKFVIRARPPTTGPHTAIQAWRTGSFAAEITSQIMEGAFDELDFPVARVCSAEVPIPYAKHLEDAALPQVSKITDTVLEMF